MAAGQTTESRAAISLLIVLAVAKAIMLAGHPVALSVWAPIVYSWQDVLVALIFGLVFGGRIQHGGRVFRPAAWIVYAAVCFWIAINVPIARALSTPLTLTMMRGAGGPLADSLSSRLTIPNITAVLTVLATAAVAPRLLTRLNSWTPRRLAVAALVWCMAGVMTTPRVDTVGRHRNAVTTLLPRMTAGVSSGPGAGEWRTSPFGSTAVDDVSRYRASAKQSNVLLISLESTAARYLGIYGAARDPMPNLSRLAAGGLVADNAYAVYPESIKGLFSTLCSRFPAYDTTAESYADVPCRSIAQALKDDGYRTAMFHSGRFDYLGMRAVIERRGFDVLQDAGAIGGNVESSFGIDEPSTVRRMLQWIDGLPKGDRFFVTYLPIAGHHPYATTAPGPFTGGTEFNQYLNALHEGDAALGELLDGLAARHLADNTLIVVFGDHGEAFGQHDGNFAHTQFIYDENMRVPLVIKTPKSSKNSESPVRIRRVASLVDLTPTMLDLLGRPVSPEYQGVSLLSSTPVMALFFTDYSLGWLGLRDGCWKHIFQIEAARSTLFDVCADPDERTDRSAEQPERVRAYRERLEAWIASR